MSHGENVSLACGGKEREVTECDIGKILQVLSEGWSQGICQQGLVWLVGLVVN